MTALTFLLYAPVALWLALGLWLAIAYRTAAPPTLLRLASLFLALWAVLATTTLLWVLSNGGVAGLTSLAGDPLEIFALRYVGIWFFGALGALAVFVVAFLLNQLVGRGFLALSRPVELDWPATLPRPREAVTYAQFESARPEGFSFTLLEYESTRRPRWRRREVILVSRGLVGRLTPEERDAAVAHELGHIRGLDSRYLTFLRTLSRMMRWDPMLAYLASSLTRREEYRADDEAARLTHNPLALARALFKASTVGEPETGGGFARFLGAAGRRGRRDALLRIRRLVALAETPEYRVPPAP